MNQDTAPFESNENGKTDKAAGSAGQEQNHNALNIPALKSIPKSIMAGRYAYLLLGLAMAVWASLIPYAKTRISVNEAQLGMLLLCLGFGAALSMPFAGSLTAKYGCRAMQCIGIPLYYLSLFGLAVMPSPVSLALCLCFFGVWSGTLDVVMNIQVAYLEQTSKRRLMSAIHAMYMIGAAIGAGSMSVLLKITRSPVLSTLIICILCILGFLYYQAYFFPKIQKETQEKTSLIIIPKGIIFWLGFICFFLYMIEGVLMDWSALFMHEIRGVDLSNAGLAYAIFAVTMTCGRLLGDRLGARFGTRRLLFCGTACAAVCFFAISLVSSVFFTFFAFFCLGIFASNTVPMLFSLVTKNTVGSLDCSIAGVSMLGYLGLLSGPAIMGFMAHHFGLVYVFATMGAFLAGVTLLLKYLKVRE